MAKTVTTRIVKDPPMRSTLGKRRIRKAIQEVMAEEGTPHPGQGKGRKRLETPMLADHSDVEISRSHAPVREAARRQFLDISKSKKFASGKLLSAITALEREIIRYSLYHNENDLSRTAMELGLSRRGLRLKPA